MKTVDKSKEAMFSSSSGVSMSNLYHKEKLRASMKHHINHQFGLMFKPQNAMETSNKPPIPDLKKLEPG